MLREIEAQLGLSSGPAFPASSAALNGGEGGGVNGGGGGGGASSSSHAPPSRGSSASRLGLRQPQQQSELGRLFAAQRESARSIRAASKSPALSRHVSRPTTRPVSRQVSRQLMAPSSFESSLRMSGGMEPSATVAAPSRRSTGADGDNRDFFLGRGEEAITGDAGGTLASQLASLLIRARCGGGPCPRWFQGHNTLYFA